MGSIACGFRTRRARRGRRTLADSQSLFPGDAPRRDGTRRRKDDVHGWRFSWVAAYNSDDPFCGVRRVDRWSFTDLAAARQYEDRDPIRSLPGTIGDRSASGWGEDRRVVPGAAARGVVVRGQWSVVSGRWLVSGGRWSGVGGQGSVVRGQGSAVSCNVLPANAPTHLDSRLKTQDSRPIEEQISLTLQY